MPENCIFCKIVAGEIPASVVYEDDSVIAIRDINPQAPVHLLIIPREHVSGLSAVEESHVEMAGRALLAARRVADSQDELADGFRLIEGSRFLLAEGTSGRIDEVTIAGDRATIRVLREGLNSSPGVTLVGDTAYASEGKIGYLIDPKLKGEA